MASQADVINSALQIIGSSTQLDSIDDDHPDARAIAVCYDILRKELLRKHPWNFAKKRATLTALSTQTVWGDLDVFVLPADCVRLLRPTDRHVDWEIEYDATTGYKVIVTNEGDTDSSGVTTLDIRYIADVNNEALFDDAFTQVFAARIAMRIAPSVTGSGEKTQMAKDAYAEAMRDARSNNAFERGPDAAIDDDYLLAMR